MDAPMDIAHLTSNELYAALDAGAEDLSPASGTVAIVLGDDDSDDESVARLATAVTSVPCPIIAEPALERLAAVVDTFASGDQLDAVLAQAARTPLATAAMALLLRSTLSRTIEEGLVAESVTYSMLQSGPEFNRWRASREPRDRPEAADAVLVDRVG